MRISARCDYACRALLGLALHWPNKKPMPIHTISKGQKIPMRYLVQILIQLKRLGLVASVRGKDGGYNLVKPPSRIKLGEVIRQMGGPLVSIAESSRSRESVFTAIWAEIEDTMAGILDKISFEDIATRAKGVRGAIIYQI